MKKIIRFVFLLIVGVVLALVLLPFVFEDKIKELLKTEINKNVNAVVDFSDVDLSFIKSFPQARITLTDLKIDGVDTFSNVTLLSCPSGYVETSMLPLFNSDIKPSISYVSLSKPSLHIVKHSPTLANYLITKPNADTSSFSIALEGYEVKDGKLRYEDLALAVQIEAEGVNHTGSGQLSTDIYDLTTKTDAQKFSVTYEGFNYLQKVKANLDAVVHVDLKNEKYSVTGAKALLNKLQLAGDGYVDFEGEDMYLNGKFKSLGSKFDDFVSALPFIAQDKTYQASGNALLDLSVDGLYDGIKGIYPKFVLAVDIKNGNLKYAELPYPVENVDGQIKISATKPKLEDLKISVPQFGLAINKERISGQLNVDRGLTNPIVKGSLKGTLNLDNWQKALPLQGVEYIKGKFESNLDFDAALADVEAKRYDKIKFDGQCNVANLAYKAKDGVPMTCKTASIAASPKLLQIASETITYGASDFKLDGTLNDPLAVFSQKEGVRGSLKLTSDLIDLNEIQSKNAKSSSAANATPFDINKYATSEIDASVSIKKLKYDKHEIKDIVVDGKAGANAIDINKLSAMVNQSDIELSGKVVNALDYLMNNALLQGELNLKSNYLNLNDYMTSATATTTSQAAVMPVPANVSILINSNIKKVDYTNLTFENVTGKIVVANQEAKLEDVLLGIFGGKISVAGLYGTQSLLEPKYSIKLGLEKLRIEDAYSKFVTMQSLMPIGKLLSGYLNTTLVMDGTMGQDMTPRFPTLNAQGFIETINSTLGKFSILNELGEKLGVDELAKVNLAQSRNWFEVKNGFVELKEKVWETSGIGIRISGKHQIMGPMEYKLFLKIPRSKIKQSKVGNAADKGLTWVQNEAKRKGVNIDQGEFIDFRVDLSGMLLKPNMVVTPLGASGQSLTEEVKKEIEKEIKKTTDSLITVVKDKKTQLEDTVRTRLEKELEAAKQKALEEAEKKAKEVINSAKTEVKKEIESRLDSTISSAVKDSLGKKAEEILKSKTGSDAKDILKKIEDFNPFKKKKGNG